MGFEFIAGDLSLDFINTFDPPAGPVPPSDSLHSYRDLVDWAAGAGVISASQRASRLRLAKENPQAAETSFRQAVQFRGSLHRLVLALMEHRSPASEDLRRFNAFLSHAQAQVQLHAAPEGYSLQLVNDPQQPGSLLWPIASAASRLLTSGDAQFIRRCDAESCRWFFVDRSKNHSRRWCDMKVCGNRAKARKFYRQRKNAD
ncbi:MAG: ABATE domain-containing protein [Acidobacteriota bacterium]